MKNYQELLQYILHHGERVSNRTGIDTLTIPAAMLQFDLRDGFPAMTTKELNFRSVVGELIGFLRGYTSAADFRALGCNIWNQNANENKDWLASPYRKGEDDLGRIYSAQWRAWDAPGQWQGHESVGIDQIAVALDQLRHSPESRRILVTAWNPAELDQAALPPCHVLFKLMPNPATRVLHLSYYQRSCDTFLGVPFNIASYALLLELFAAWSGYTPGILTAHMDDVHLYVNHLDQVREQLAREPLLLPKLRMRETVGIETAPLDEILQHLTPQCLWLDGYQSHSALRAPMAV